MIVLNFNRRLRVVCSASSTAVIKIQRAPGRGPRFHAAIASLPAGKEGSGRRVREGAVEKEIGALVIAPRRPTPPADTARPRIETNLCRGRQSRTDRHRRHKRNSKLPHYCLLCWLHS